MIYTWKHLETGETVEVTRKMADSDVPPTPEEAEEAGVSSTPNWEKVITGGSMSIGFGLKGMWGKA